MLPITRTDHMTMSITHETELIRIEQRTAIRFVIILIILTISTIVGRIIIDINIMSIMLISIQRWTLITKVLIPIMLKLIMSRIVMPHFVFGFLLKIRFVSMRFTMVDWTTLTIFFTITTSAPPVSSLLHFNKWVEIVHYFIIDIIMLGLLNFSRFSDVSCICCRRVKFSSLFHHLLITNQFTFNTISNWCTTVISRNITNELSKNVTN